MAKFRERVACITGTEMNTLDDNFLAGLAHGVAYSARAARLTYRSL